MKHKKINPILFYCLLLFFVACEERVDLGNNFEERLAVTCHFSPDEPFMIFVSKTKDPLSDEASVYVKNAEVLLYEGEDLHCELTYNEEPGIPVPFYFNESCMPETGSVYTLRIKASGFDEVFATNVIPAPTTFESFEFSNLEVQFESDSIANFQFEVSILLNEVTEVPAYYLLDLNYERVPYQIIGLDTIIERTGEFDALLLETLPGNPVIINHFDEQKRGVLFTQKEPGALSLRFKVVTPRPVLLTMDIFDRVYGNLRTITEDYYNYHLHLSRQALQQDSFFLEPVVLYNNIENGYGIFAGYQLTRDSLSIDYQ